MLYLSCSPASHTETLTSFAPCPAVWPPPLYPSLTKHRSPTHLPFTHPPNLLTVRRGLSSWTAKLVNLLAERTSQFEWDYTQKVSSGLHAVFQFYETGDVMSLTVPGKSLGAPINRSINGKTDQLIKGSATGPQNLPLMPDDQTVSTSLLSTEYHRKAGDPNHSNMLGTLRGSLTSTSVTWTWRTSSSKLVFKVASLGHATVTWPLCSTF